jgi:hypothetical protein
MHLMPEGEDDATTFCTHFRGDGPESSRSVGREGVAFDQFVDAQVALVTPNAVSRRGGIGVRLIFR